MPRLEVVLDAMAAASGLSGPGRRMCLRRAVSTALGACTQLASGDEIIGQATDLQQAVESAEGQTFGSPGRAFAAVRTRLPEQLRVRA